MSVVEFFGWVVTAFLLTVAVVGIVVTLGMGVIAVYAMLEFLIRPWRKP